MLIFLLFYRKTSKNLLFLVSKFAIIVTLAISKLKVFETEVPNTFYLLNPIYFFKGALKDRPKVVQVLLSYENE